MTGVGGGGRTLTLSPKRTEAIKELSLSDPLSFLCCLFSWADAVREQQTSVNESSCNFVIDRS